MRYTGPRGKAFSGDKGKARSLQRLADKLVGSVIQRLKAPPFNSVGYLVDRQKLDDGSWLYATVNTTGIHPIVRTWIESPTVISLAEEENPIPGVVTESGYLNVDDLSQPLDYGVELDTEWADWLGYPGCQCIGDAWITPRSAMQLPHLYALTENRNIEYVDKPISFWASELSGGATPGAEACAAAKVLRITSASPTSAATGKMRLYQQAKLGAALTASGCALTGIINASETTGIIQDELGRYYVAEISARDAEPSVSFTKLNVDSELLTAVSDAEGAWEKLAAEVDALAASEVESTPAYSARILDSEGEWEYPAFFTDYPARPLTGGWKFSWDSGKAAIVLIEPVRVQGSNALFFYKKADLRSLVYEITFAREEVEIEPGIVELRFVPRIALLESKEWLYSHNWLWWFALVGRTTTHMWQIPDGEPGVTEFSEPVDVPIYGYYTSGSDAPMANNTLSLLRVTREVLSTAAPTVSTLCGGATVDAYNNAKTYGLVDGVAAIGSKILKENTEVRLSASFGGAVYSGVARGIDQSERVSGSLGGTWVPSYDTSTPFKPNSGIVSGSYDEPANAYYQTITNSGCGYTISTSSLPTAKDLGYCPYGGHPDYDPEIAPPADVGYVRKNVSYYLVSGTFVETRAQIVGARSDRLGYAGVSLSDAEAVILTEYNAASRTTQDFTYTYNNDTWGARTDTIEIASPADPGAYPCGGTYPDWSSPEIIDPGDGNWGPIYDVNRTVTQGPYNMYAEVNGDTRVFGKSTSVPPVVFNYKTNTDASGYPKSNYGKSCPLSTPATYLVDYRGVNDETWAFGINVVQGVFGAMRAATRVTDFADTGLFVPTKREWLRQIGVTGGWPIQLADDDRTFPIGWA